MKRRVKVVVRRKKKGGLRVPLTGMEMQSWHPDKDILLLGTVFQQDKQCDNRALTLLFHTMIRLFCLSMYISK